MMKFRRYRIERLQRPDEIGQPALDTWRKRAHAAGLYGTALALIGVVVGKVVFDSTVGAWAVFSALLMLYIASQFWQVRRVR